MKRLLMCFLGCGMIAGGLFFSGCDRLGHPKYFVFKSEFGDFKTQVPWGWNVVLDQQNGGRDYYNYTFIGPYDPDFYRGVPSFSIRWYANNTPHRLPDGSTEFFAGAEDFILNVPPDVYGPNYYFEGRTKESPNPVKKIKFLGGWVGKNFTIVSPVAVPDAALFGATYSDKDGKKKIMLRKHSYSLLPMDTGFYALIYPATEAGYEKNVDRYNQMVNKFFAFKDGPFGERL